MGDRERMQEKKGFSIRIREGVEESWQSLSKIEAEGEKLIRSLAEVGEKYGLQAGTKAVEDLGRDARVFLNQLNDSIEETAEKVLNGLNVPTREDLDLYNKRIKTLIEENVKSRLERLKVPTGKDLDVMAKQLRGNLEEQVKRGLGRLNLATRKDVEAVAKDLKKLQRDVVKLSKAGASKRVKSASKKTAPKTPGKAARKKKAKK